MARRMHLPNRPFPNFLFIWGLTPKVKLDSLHRGLPIRRQSAPRRDDNAPQHDASEPGPQGPVSFWGESPPLAFVRAIVSGLPTIRQVTESDK